MPFQAGSDYSLSVRYTRVEHNIEFNLCAPKIRNFGKKVPTARKGAVLL